MQRLLLIATFCVAACAKRADKGPAQSPPAADPAATNAAPTAPGASGGSAIDIARSQANLGPSADTQAFEPLDGAPQGGEGSAARKAAAVRPPERSVTIVSIDINDKPGLGVLWQLFRTNETQLRACYDKKPSAAGSVRIAFTVRANGALSAASVQKTTVNDVDIEACIVGVIGALKVGTPFATQDRTAIVELSRK